MCKNKFTSLDMSKKISRGEIYKIIENEWPVNISGIARRLELPVDDSTKTKQIVARISYHVNELKKQEKIHTKKIDRALVVWPHEIEKIRFVHELMK